MSLVYEDHLWRFAQHYFISQHSPLRLTICASVADYSLVKSPKHHIVNLRMIWQTAFMSFSNFCFFELTRTTIYAESINSAYTSYFDVNGQCVPVWWITITLLRPRKTSNSITCCKAGATRPAGLRDIRTWSKITHTLDYGTLERWKLYVPSGLVCKNWSGLRRKSTQVTL